MNLIHNEEPIKFTAVNHNGDATAVDDADEHESVGEVGTHTGD